MKLIEVIASAVVLVLLMNALSTSALEILRLKKAAGEIRHELYLLRENPAQKDGSFEKSSKLNSSGYSAGQTELC